MRFYNVDHQGKHLLQRLTGHPTDEEARIYYFSTDDHVYISDGGGHHVLVQDDGETYNIVAIAAQYS